MEKIREIMDRSTELGMQTFDRALFDLYESGQISREVALRNADSTNDLRYRIKLNSERFKKEGPRHTTEFEMVDEPDEYKYR